MKLFYHCQTKLVILVLYLFYGNWLDELLKIDMSSPLKKVVLCCRKPIEHFLKAVDEITLKDISSIAQKIVSSSLTMASWGDGNNQLILQSLVSLILVSILN